MDRQLHIQKTLFTVNDFLSFKRIGSLVLTPVFQRRSVWKPSAKSYFMDTVFRGLPVPIIFLRDRRSKSKSLELKREVIDGQQRIRTLFSYIEPQLLEDYEEDRDFFKIIKNHNKELVGKRFNQLSVEFQNRLLQYEFSVHILPFQVSDRDVLQIFRRLNSTGYRLNSQELRNAEFFGVFKTLMYEMAASQYDRWKNWGVYDDNDIARMNEVQFTSEITIMMVQGISGGGQAGIRSYYNEYDKAFPFAIEIKRRFETICDILDDEIGQGLENLEFSRKGLLYPLFAYIYDVAFNLNSELTHKKSKKVSKTDIDKIIKASNNISNKNLPDNILEAVGKHTTNPKERKLIYEYIKGL